MNSITRDIDGVSFALLHACASPSHPLEPLPRVTSGSVIYIPSLFDVQQEEELESPFLRNTISVHAWQLGLGYSASLHNCSGFMQRSWLYCKHHKRRFHLASAVGKLTGLVKDSSNPFLLYLGFPRLSLLVWWHHFQSRDVTSCHVIRHSWKEFPLDINFDIQGIYTGRFKWVFPAVNTNFGECLLWWKLPTTQYSSCCNPVGKYASARQCVAMATAAQCFPQSHRKRQPLPFP